MRFMPLLATALALGPVLGIAVSGSINTVPKQTGGDMLAMLDSIPQHADAQFSTGPSEQSSLLPDHYPLVTPRGTIQVAELWSHGLYRGRRPARFEYEYDYDLGPELYAFELPAIEAPSDANMDIAQEEPLYGGERNMAGQSVALGAAPAGETGSMPAPPLSPDDVPARPAGPKVIDVAAVLARQQR